MTRIERKLNATFSSFIIGKEVCAFSAHWGRCSNLHIIMFMAIFINSHLDEVLGAVFLRFLVT